MIFHVRMDVNIPQDIDQEEIKKTLLKEKEYSQSLQKLGKWRHLWRITGEYSNISIFDVESNEELHNLLQGLPLFPYMDIKVMPLNRHPSSIRDNDT